MQVIYMDWIGSAVRIKKFKDGKYAVETAPLGDGDSFDYEEFGHMDTGPGQPTSVFPTRRHAGMFVELLSRIPEIRRKARIPSEYVNEIVCGEWALNNSLVSGRIRRGGCLKVGLDIYFLDPDEGYRHLPVRVWLDHEKGRYEMDWFFMGVQNINNRG